MAKGAKIQNIYPLTPMQQGMLFNYLYQKDSKAYFQQLCFLLEADLDIDIFERSVNKVIERYDIFRTIFVYEKVEEPKQVVLAERTTKVFYEDITCMDSRDREEYLDDFKRNDMEKGFDVAKDLLMRIAIIKVESKDYQVIWSHHHMILDGWCLGVVISDFIKIYQSLKYGKEHNLTKPYQYVDYINWLAKQDNTTALAYWEKYLQNYENEILLPQKVNVMKGGYDKREVHFSIDQEVTLRIVEISRKNNVTLNNVFQAIWAILLQRYNRVEDVVFGAVVSGRNAPVDGIDRMVGLFINTIPIRVNCDEHRSFTGMLEYIRDTYNQSIQYDFVSLAKIQSQCNRKQNLINQLFIFENYPVRDQSKGDTYRIKDAQSFEQTNYDFNIVIVPSDVIHIKLKYNGFLYEDKLVEAIKGHILQIINSICDNPDIQLKDIRILTDSEYDQIVYELNPNTRNTICNTTIKEMFEEQVIKSPDTIAVVYQNEKITYRELNERSNSLARVLRYHGVKKDTLVALMTERSIEMIIGILSILKAGGAYLPIDAEYPAERVQYMLEDSDTKFILTNTEIKGILFKGEILDLRQEDLYTKHHINLGNNTSPSDLAYTIYTSGTTGKPKGVMIENRCVVNLSANIYKKIYSKYSSILNVALLSPYVFDASVKQIFPSLLYGQTLVIVPDEERMDGEKLVHYYIQHRIDLSDGTPAHLGIIHEVLQSNKYRLPTRHFLIGGEALSVDLVRDFFLVYGSDELRITNVYGPTECCDVSTMYEVDSFRIGELSKIPIGYALDHVQIYLLDGNLNPVPYDIPGEIYIAGDGVSRGYLNQKGLTEERFIANPFLAGEVMYRTGDLGKRLRSGEIEYLGRVDHQVKIRGYRIELEEIEKHIHAFHGVKEAAAVCGENVQGEKYIAAFVHFDNTENSHINSEEVAFKADHKPSNADNKEKHIPPISDDDSYHTSNNSHNIELLRLHLSKTLPSYMIPTYIIEIDRIPITHNGKIDRKQLLAMVGKEDTHYTAPRNKFEEELTKVWGQILGMERISINDDFFVIGGDDEIAFRLSMELQKRNITMNLSDLRLYPTIEKLVDHLKYEDSNLEQQDVTGNVELTPIQRDFFERNRNNKDRWNQAFCLFREEGFDVKLVRQVFQKITEHHDALRLRYIAKDSEVVQYHTEINENAFTLEEYNYSGYDNVKGRIQEVANRMQGDINIMNGPLLKLGLFRTKQGDHLLIIIHHLVVDGVSWRIILEDFTTGYKQLLHQELIVLTPKTHSFQYWAEQLKRYSSTDKALKELTYWEGITHANNERLKKDGYVSTREFRYMQSEELVISKEETIHLLKQVHRAYGTQTNEILLAILGLTLKDWFGLEKVLINLEGHGREEIIDDVNIKRTVGWFTSFYPVILDMSSSEYLGNFINDTKESLRRIPNKGMGYGILKYLSNLSSIDLDRIQCRPEINFNYLGQISEDIENDLFTLSDAPIGECVDLQDESQYALNIIGKVNHQQLSISFKYSAKEFKKENIVTLKERFYEKLNEVVMHCKEVANLLKSSQFDYAEPRNQVEKELVTVWENILGVNRIGIYDDFFELGGDSIKAIKILSKANTLKIPVSVKAILEYRTVANIMDHYSLELSNADGESAASLQNGSEGRYHERVFNKKFQVTTEYPSYYGCMTGVILEKLRHERNVNIERSFLAVGGGKSFITYGHVNRKGKKQMLKYRELPTEMIPDVANIFDELGVTEEVKSFENLEAGLAYCREHLGRNELVMISGSTYYLNYTPDYCIGEEVWRNRLDIRPENRIAVTDKSSGRAHTFLLIDILKDGYLVYDTTFKYYGVIPVEDFERSFAGLRGMRFLDGTYAQTTNLPYAVTELDLSNVNKVDNRHVGLEVLRSNVDINLSNKRLDFSTSGNDFTFYIGVRVYKEIATMLSANRSKIDDVNSLIQSCFGSWKYKFMFFKEFLKDLSQYMNISNGYIDYCDNFINECESISSLPSLTDSENAEELVTDICSKLDAIYEQQTHYFEELKDILEEVYSYKGDRINV